MKYSLECQVEMLQESVMITLRNIPFDLQIYIIIIIYYQSNLPQLLNGSNAGLIVFV